MPFYSNLNFSSFQGKAWTMKNISSCVLLFIFFPAPVATFEIHVEELHP
jgi:hypothetical protein